MSLPKSKLETYIESYRSIPIDIPQGYRDAAFEALRGTKPRPRGLQRLALMAAPLAVFTIGAIALLWSRPSEASEIWNVLNKDLAGVVRQHRTTIWKGEREQIEIFSNGKIERVKSSLGSETRIEPGRLISRAKEGYITIQEGDYKAGPFSPVKVKSLLEQHRGSIIRHYRRADGDLFEVDGTLVDGQQNKRHFSVKLSADPEGRPVWEHSTIEGLGETFIELSYGHSEKDLEITPSDRVYNISAQRKKLEEQLSALNASIKQPQAINAYLDEQGNMAVLVAVPQFVANRGDKLFVNGAEVTIANYSFNRHFGNDSAWVDAPAMYQGQAILTKTFRVSTHLVAPFRVQFPLWTFDPPFRMKSPFHIYDYQYSVQPRSMHKVSVVVNSYERTAGLAQLLAPRNVPFFAEDKGLPKDL